MLVFSGVEHIARCIVMEETICCGILKVNVRVIVMKTNIPDVFHLLKLNLAVHDSKIFLALLNVVLAINDGARGCFRGGGDISSCGGRHFAGQEL